MVETRWIHDIEQLRLNFVSTTLLDLHTHCSGFDVAYEWVAPSYQLWYSSL